MLSDSSPIHLHSSVEEAIRGGSPVVALESTIISHGLPRPENIRVAGEIESIVAANGATPDGLRNGFQAQGLERQVRIHVHQSHLIACRAHDDPVAVLRVLGGQQDWLSILRMAEL